MTARSIRPLVVFLMAFAALGASPAPTGQPPERQYWMGEIDTGAAGNPTLPFMATLWQENGAWRGVLDIPPSTGIPGAWSQEFAHVEVDADRLELIQAPTQPHLPANTFALVRSPAGADEGFGRLLVGGGEGLTMRMWRVGPVEAADFMPRRPQLPVAPWPYERRQVMVPSTRDGVTVENAGILTLPEGAGPHPAVLLVGAMGAHDADHTSLTHKPFVVLADRLARAGIASLRVHDRTPASTFAALQTQVTIEQLGAEAAEKLAWLAGRPEIAARRVGLIGLNEGCTAAALAASSAPDTARCVVMLSPSGLRGVDQIRAEFSEALRIEGETPAFIERRLATFIRPYELLAAGAPSSEVIEAIFQEMTSQRAARRQQFEEAKPEQVRGMAADQFRIINTVAFQHMLNFDPATALAEMSQPALAILGAKDARCPLAVNKPAVEAALTRDGVERIIRVGEGLNHRLQPCESGQLDEVPQIELTFDEDVLRDTAAFLARHLSVAPTREGETR